MVTTAQGYHQALADLVVEQDRRKKLSKPQPGKPEQQQQPSKPPVNSNERNMSPKKPAKTFQLFVAHTQPKRKPPLRVQLLRRLYKRRKKHESDTFRLPRIRPSRVWNVT